MFVKEKKIGNFGDFLWTFETEFIKESSAPFSRAAG